MLHKKHTIARGRLLWHGALLARAKFKQSRGSSERHPRAMLDGREIQPSSGKHSGAEKGESFQKRFHQEDSAPGVTA